MKKLAAKEIIPDKYYIVESDGSKVGIIRSTDYGYEFFDTTANTKQKLESFDDFEIVKENKKTTNFPMVYGYPTNCDTVYHTCLLDNVPTFKKRQLNGAHFVAGYWAIKYATGWVTNFCPKLKTIKEKECIGPFKNEMDVKLAIVKNEMDKELEIKLAAAKRYN